MRGEVLAVASAVATGVISGDDGRRYSFAITDMRTSHPFAGQEVNFQAAGEEARDVYAVGSGVAPYQQEPKRDWVRFYLSPTGRITRQEYWLYGLLVTFAATLVLGWIPILGQILSVATTWSSTALAFKRFHDVGYSGWWSFVAVPPIILMIVSILGAPHNVMLPSIFGIIALIAILWVFFGILIQRGEFGPNRFGPDPFVYPPR